MRTGCTGRLAPRPHVLYVRGTRTSLGRWVRTGYRGNPGHLELCTGLAVCAVAFVVLRSRLLASCLGCGALAVCWLVSALGINLFEALLCRPWIWLIMGRRD